ncbi:MAG TPA: alpha-L-rhamnosidase, partial [Chitinophagaceae bacterium]|nr:alpha-L-rhamnosidase [Chitinophagaceae bacterium]
MKRLLIITSLFFSIKNVQAQLQVTNLRCEYSTHPLGVETAAPHFSWQLQSTQKNVLQTAYKVIVSDDSLLLKKGTANTWNSNRVQSAASIQIQYAGKKLQS